MGIKQVNWITWVFKSFQIDRIMKRVISQGVWCSKNVSTFSSCFLHNLSLWKELCVGTMATWDNNTLCQIGFKAWPLSWRLGKSNPVWTGRMSWTACWWLARAAEHGAIYKTDPHLHQLFRRMLQMFYCTWLYICMRVSRWWLNSLIFGWTVSLLQQ